MLFSYFLCGLEFAEIIGEVKQVNTEYTPPFSILNNLVSIFSRSGRTLVQPKVDILEQHASIDELPTKKN
jgi:hypothetical protein